MATDLGDTKYDLAANAQAGKELQLKDPYTGRPTDLHITIVGSDSPRYRLAFREIQDEVADDPRMRSDLETGDDRLARALAKCVTGWRDGDDPHWTFGGNKYECEEKAAAFIFNQRRWILEQCSVFAAQRANFFDEPKNNSSAQSDRLPSGTSKNENTGDQT